MSNQNSITRRAISLLRYYSEYHAYYSLLKKSQYWNAEQLQAYQNEQLHKLIEHAYNHVPYYRHIFQERNLTPADIQTTADLTKLPLLTKDDIREHQDELITDTVSKGELEEVRTSGTSGKPLGFYYEKGKSRAQEMAFIKTQWERVGYHYYDKCVILRSRVVSESTSEVFWEKTLFGRWLYLSSYYMTEENMPRYLEKIQDFSPRYIHAFPSTICALATYLREHHISPVLKLKAILCGSENLYSWQRELLEGVFHCRVYSWYGHSEQAVLAGECEVSSDYHIFSEYGVTEIVSDSGSLITEPNISGEIVVTNLKNYSYPLIRYCTNDIGSYATGHCPCGRNYSRLNRLEGRKQDYVYSADKRKLAVSGIFGVDHTKAMGHIRKYQIRQDVPGKIVFALVPASSYDYSKDEAELRDIFSKNLGGILDVEILYEKEIPTLDNGKYRFVLQNVNLGA